MYFPITCDVEMVTDVTESPMSDMILSARDVYKRHGYIVINKIIGVFTNNPIFLFFVMAFLSVGINLSCYKKYTPYFFTAILFYYVHTYIDVYKRQMLSFSFYVGKVLVQNIQLAYDTYWQWIIYACISLSSYSFVSLALLFLGDSSSRKFIIRFCNIIK